MGEQLSALCQEAEERPRPFGELARRTVEAVQTDLQPGQTAQLSCLPTLSPCLPDSHDGWYKQRGLESPGVAPGGAHHRGKLGFVPGRVECTFQRLRSVCRRP